MIIKVPNSLRAKDIFVVLCIGFLNLCQSQKPISEHVKNQIQSRVDNGINTGIVVGVIENNNVTYYSYGLKSLKSNEPVNEKSVFEIGSISKAFTGILLADMVLKNKVKLDDPLQKYLPDAVKVPTRNGESIKLVHLANHTSSLPRMPSNFNPSDPNNPFVDYKEKELYEFLSTYKPTRDIGSEYEYSNYGAGLLGYILATQNNMSYEKLMVTTIGKPLGLKDTRIALTPKMKKKLAFGHSGGVEVQNWDFETLAGAGAIRSNAIDMVKFLKFNMGINNSSLYSAMELSHINSRKEDAKPIVGFGWHTLVIDKDSIVWHNGGTGGYSTFIGFIKEDKKGVVVLSNSNSSVDDIGLHLLNIKSPLNDVKPSIAIKLRQTIDAQGIEKGIQAYWNFKNNSANEFNFSESELEKLAFDYFVSKELEKAMALTKLNTEAYPNSSNVFYGYAEVLLKKGDSLKAIENYKKSLEINSGNQQAIQRLEQLDVSMENLVKEVVVDISILEGYLGKYELAPNFILTVSKEGNQLKAQATGQLEFPIFPRSENVFYLKVIEAQLTFNSDENGRVTSVTLVQGGQEMTGKKY